MSRAVFVRATPADEADLRALLRENAMPGWVQMAATREPHYFDGCDQFGEDAAAIVREHGRTVGMFAVARHTVHCNGMPGEAGYLGALRVHRQYRHRIGLLRDGFAYVPQLLSGAAPTQWYTVIAQDNLPARRLLEAGVAGLPRYCDVGGLVSLTLPRARGKRHGLWQPVASEALPALCQLHNTHAQRWQFAPVLRADAATRTGAGFYGVMRHGRYVACLGLWNQQAYRQIRALEYRSPLRLLLPAYNTWARFARRMPLPHIGDALDHAYAAFCAIDAAAPNFVELLEDALTLCPAQGLTLGMHAAHSWLPRLRRRFRPVEYAMRVYRVQFDASSDNALDERPAQPEVALL